MVVRNLRFLSLFLLLLVLCVGCGTVRPLMPVPATLESSSVMAVQRRQHSLGAVSFGEFRVSSFEKKGFPGQTRWGLGIERVSFSKSRAAASYRFVMTPNDREQWQCDCQHTLKRRELGLGALGEAELTYQESLNCELRRVGEDEFWNLVVDGSLAIGGEGYAGKLDNGSRSLVLRSSNEIKRLGRLPGPPVGYLFMRDREVVAATELIRPGIVRISDEAEDDRDLIATAAAALLMAPTEH